MDFCGISVIFCPILLFAIKCHVLGELVSKHFEKQEIPGGTLQLTGYLKTQPVTSLLQCANQCTHDDACSNFYYNSDEKSCLLHDVTAQDWNVYSAPASNTVHYEHNDGVFLECPVNNGGWTKARLQDGDVYLFRLFTSSAVSQTQAVELCNSTGSHPLRILTAEKMQFVQNNLTQCAEVSGHEFWVDGTNAGATNYSAPDAYRTTDNQVVPLSTDALWGSLTGPNDNVDAPRCLWIAPRFSYYFDDVPCTYAGVKFICEKQLVL